MSGEAKVAMHEKPPLADAIQSCANVHLGEHVAGLPPTATIVMTATNRAPFRPYTRTVKPDNTVRSVLTVSPEGCFIDRRHFRFSQVQYPVSVFGDDRSIQATTHLVVSNGTVESALTISPDVSAVHRGYYSRYFYSAQMLN